ncbi:arabinogalactan oligomer/maltooligosaccharide transport system permease protein [Nocardioides aromaticivorans]|uniref:Arabinogalactan oligomer/maltooligosaccharide transport system permease protein n=1 Tax=Nocardioides aromaticivorans TaxID=200618 RepID=A0A7Y9ZG53_9ACTN|nr:carbohydrate ABC transporter permease [Nocardioides aromaticivorans]NYI44787.1 arabinogalactan oligomer/maltooligosaccharide transport system permease protein [Nocardioides aromaticivorans]
MTRRPRGREERSVGASIALHGTLLMAVTIALFPVVWVLLASLKPKSAIQSSEVALFDHPTLDNYHRVLFDTNFPTWFLNSVIVAAFTMLVGMAMSATAGYALSRFNFPGKRSLMWVFLITQMFPVAILIVPIYTIMASLNLIDTKASLVIAYCTVAVPFCTWMLRGYFDTIPRDLDEAAAIDGLGPFKTFWFVILPLARPGLAVTAFYTFLTAWGEVAYAIAFILSDKKLTLGAGLQQFVPQFNPQWDLLTAGAVLIMLPASLVFYFAQKHLVAGLTAGGTKG